MVPVHARSAGPDHPNPFRTEESFHGRCEGSIKIVQGVDESQLALYRRRAGLGALHGAHLPQELRHVHCLRHPVQSRIETRRSRGTRLRRTSRPPAWRHGPCGSRRGGRARIPRLRNVFAHACRRMDAVRPRGPSRRRLDPRILGHDRTGHSRSRCRSAGEDGTGHHQLCPCAMRDCRDEQIDGYVCGFNPDGTVGPTYHTNLREWRQRWNRGLSCLPSPRFA